jgi:hypothetical protein
MMSITSIADWQNKTDAEVLAELLADVFVPTNRQVLFADISGVVGLEAAALVVGTIKAASAQNPLLETVLIAMSTVGLNIGTPERQAMIGQLALAGGWPDQVRDSVKALGGVTVPRWQQIGMSEPTIESVAAERQAKAAMQAYRDLHSKWLVPVLDGELSFANLAAALQSMATELEAMQ